MKRVQILIDDELLKRVDAEAEKINMTRSEYIRNALESQLSKTAAVEGVDTTVKLLRALLKDELNPHVNRLAGMISKATKAAATGMYLQVLELQTNKDINAVEAYQKAEARAVAYLTHKE